MFLAKRCTVNGFNFEIATIVGKSPQTNVTIHHLLVFSIVTRFCFDRTLCWKEQVFFNESACTHTDFF